MTRESPTDITDRILKPPRGGWKRRMVALALRLSRKMMQQGRKHLAIQILKRAAKFAPEILIVRICWARVAMDIGDDITAGTAIREEQIDQSPNLRIHSVRIAAIYLALEDLAAAEKYLLIAKATFPGSSNTWRMLGTVFRQRGDIEQAVSHYEQASTLGLTKQQQIDAIKDIATTYTDAGRRDVESIYRRLLELEPNNPFAWYGLVECRQELDPHDQAIGTIHELIESRSIAESKKSHLHYALGIAYDAFGSHGAAFAHLMIANRIRAKNSPPFSIIRRKEDTEARCAIFTRELIQQLSRHGCPDDVLICVVGMPRSGTTLTEQILGSHSSVRPLGERNDFWRLPRNLPMLLKSRTKYPECCRELTANNIEQLWRMILDRMRRTAGPCERVVTKLPEDFFEIGMIRILFPKTRIINCRRNPLDVGLSCFRQNFRHIPYSHDLDSLAEVFKLYHRIMQHWSAVLPAGSILELKYENLVTDPERVVRGMCDFVGIPFEESCMNFDRQRRLVKTMSRWQVRQPIYTTSVNRADPYREYLGPLLELEEQPSSGGSDETRPEAPRD